MGALGLLDAVPNLAVPALNISDRIMLSVDRALHFMGFAGLDKYQ